MAQGGNCGIGGISTILIVGENARPPRPALQALSLRLKKSVCMKPALTLSALLAEAAAFCEQARSIPELFGVTDGKAVGTFIEHTFKQQLQERYVLEVGSSASGIDLPGAGKKNEQETTRLRSDCAN